MLGRIDVLIREIEEEPSKSGLKCEKCKKLCKSKQSNSRYQNFKQRIVQPGHEEVCTSTAAEDRLNLACFKDCTNHCAK